MEKKLTDEEKAIEQNGGRPVVQTFKFRHPDTGELIADVKEWQDGDGNWLPTVFDEKLEKFVVVKTESEGK